MRARARPPAPSPSGLSTADEALVARTVEVAVERLALARAAQTWSFLELLSTFLLSAATLASSWSAYQATRWGGEETLMLGRANVYRAESVRASNRALQQSQIDVTAFVAWVQSRAQGNRDAAGFMQERFRAEFVPAFRAWVESAPPGQVPSGTPFGTAAYQLAAQKESQDLAAQATAAFAQVQQFNQTGDNFVFAVVLFTSAVFFSGIQTKLQSRRMRLVLLTFASGLLVLGLVYMLGLPQHALGL